MKVTKRLTDEIIIMSSSLHRIAAWANEVKLYGVGSIESIQDSSISSSRFASKLARLIASSRSPTDTSISIRLPNWVPDEGAWVSTQTHRQISLQEY
ncbi:hypothetical protein CU097_006068 [Rhizopus azygosporus]|uniref:Uncharacterized protein n=1 Tax=Rhizopus azygosporus TaxID=86630 RepID=A0A367JFL5_RHIAZ|nr:hypothetical protein CU097_006068 [Rhizopus azygosporus]